MGAGIGTFSFILQVTEPPQRETIITGMWSSYGQNSYNILQNTLVYIPNLLIVFTIDEGENAFFMFNGIVEFESTSGFVQFVFWINDQTYPENYATLEVPNVGGANFTTPISFFYTLYSFLARVHDATVSVYTSSASSTLWFSKLLIQTFI
ncbi:MAG: hypothetical protein ACFFDF_15365 [Candidatus Odinarchaeota archaeon]